MNLNMQIQSHFADRSVPTEEGDHLIRKETHDQCDISMCFVKCDISMRGSKFSMAGALGLVSSYRSQ